MSDIFEEVEEEVRKDRMAEVWSKFGWIVWVAAFLIIGGVAVSEFLSFRNSEVNASRSLEIETAIEAIDAGNFDIAEGALNDLVDEDAAASPMIAHLLADFKLSDQGDREGAGSALADVASAEEGAFEQVALLKSVYLGSDSLTLTDVEAELAPLAAKSSPIGALAQEMIAAKAFAEGDYERARRDFNRLRFAANAPAGLVQRATIALDAIPRTSTEENSGADVPDDDAPIETEDTP